MVDGFDVVSCAGPRSHGDHGEFSYYHDNTVVLQDIEEGFEKLINRNVYILLIS
jgi:hypothetical protein